MQSFGAARCQRQAWRTPTCQVPAHLRRGIRCYATQKAAVDQLLELCSGTGRGVQTSAEKKEQILNAVASMKSNAPTTTPDLSATWKLIWTTEQESLFILEKAGWFGTEAGDVYQVIDVEEQTLQNVITFPPEGAFIVDSSISIAGEQRVDFKFGAAALKVNGIKIPFPPFGQGWFDTVYMDDDIRIAQDIRGDTLIVARDGPPRKFT